MCFDIISVGFGRVVDVMNNTNPDLVIKPLVVKNITFSDPVLSLELVEFDGAELNGFDILIDADPTSRPDVVKLNVNTDTFFVDPTNFTFTKLLDVVENGDHEPGYQQIVYSGGEWWGKVSTPLGAEFNVGPFDNPVKAWLMYKHTMAMLQS